MKSLHRLSKAIGVITNCGDCNGCCNSDYPDSFALLTPTDSPVLDTYSDRDSEGNRRLRVLPNDPGSKAPYHCVFLETKGDKRLCQIHSTVAAVIDGQEVDQPKTCQFYPFYMHSRGHISVDGSCWHIGSIIEKLRDRDPETMEALAVIRELLPQLNEDPLTIDEKYEDDFFESFLITIPIRQDSP